MAVNSVDFRNISGAKKCASSSPRLVSLEIGAESPGCANESAVDRYFLDHQVSLNDLKNNEGLVYGCDGNVLIHSQLSLSKSSCDGSLTDNAKATNDNDVDLSDILNSVKLADAVNASVENTNFKKNTADDKTEVISNVDENGSLSDLLSSIAQETSIKDVNTIVDHRKPQNTQVCGIELLDFDFDTNENMINSPSTNNLPLTVEGNLSDILSLINIGDSHSTNAGNFNTRNICNLQDVSQVETEKHPEVPNLTDLLSSIDLGKSNIESCYQTKMKVVETNDKSCLNDLLLSVDIEKPVLNNKPLGFGSTNSHQEVLNLSDLLSSIDLGKSNNESCYQTKMKVVETDNELCLADLLQSVDIDKPVLNNKSLSFGCTNLSSKSSNSVSDSFKDIAFDVSDSSNTSYASSLSEAEDNSPVNSSMKINLKNKVLESDSSYGSLDSANKGFSFFDYSSNNQYSLNTLLSDNSGFSKETTRNSEDPGNADEEMSMSDLLTIVSPDFKIPVWANLNKEGKPNSSVNDSNMLDFTESLDNKSKNFNQDENVDCVDGLTSKNTRSGIRTLNSKANGNNLEKDILMDGSDIVRNCDKFTIDDQIPFIDLRECIKSVKHELTPKSPIKQIKSSEKLSSKRVSPHKVQLYCEEKPLSLSPNSPNQFELHDRIPMKKIRVNSKQTMFSKALACKPKKDQSLLQKVAIIKNELLNNIMYPPVLFDCNVPQPIVEIVLQSDRCVVPNMDRKSFGLYEACELQL